MVNRSKKYFITRRERATKTPTVDHIPLQTRIKEKTLAVKPESQKHNKGSLHETKH